MDLEQLNVVVPDFLLLAALNPGSGIEEWIPIVYPQTKDPRALFTVKTMHEILWGYVDSVLPVSFPGIQLNDSSVESAQHQHSLNTVYVGQQDVTDMMNFASWDGMDSLQCCKNGVAGESGSRASGSCGAAYGTLSGDSIRGSFGEQWHPLIRSNEILHISTHDFGMLRTW